MKKEMVIIQHPTSMEHISFDILLLKGNKRKDELKEYGYQINNCGYVREFLEENPDYEYIFSEDNGHIPELNWINNFANNEIKKGAKLITFIKVKI